MAEIDDLKSFRNFLVADRNKFMRKAAVEEDLDHMCRRFKERQDQIEAVDRAIAGILVDLAPAPK